MTMYQMGLKSHLHASQDENLSALACEIEDRTKTWRLNQNSDADLIALTSIVSHAAQKCHVIGGAFGILNSRTNRFELWRRYHETDNDTLFPYLPPSGSGLMARYGRDLTAVPKNPEIYSDWMHALFGLLRERQGPVSEVEATRKIKAPEFLWEFAKPDSPPHLYASSDQIADRLRQWAGIWALAASNPDGLSLSIEDQTGRSHFQNINGLDQLSVYDVICKAAELTRPVTFSLFRDCPDHQYFIEKPLQEDSPDAEHIERTRDLLKELLWGELIKTLRGSKTLSELRTEMSECRNLWAMLDSLHRSAEFPIIPYLLLCLVEVRSLHHIVLPLIHSTAFPIDGVLENGTPFTTDCPLVFVATIATASDFLIEQDSMNNLSESRRKRAEQFAPLKLLMRIAGQPLADMVFYGGIQKQIVQSAVTEDMRRVLAHQIKDVGLAAGGRWLVTPKRWEHIRKSFAGNAELNALLDRYLIAPVPDLYRALGKTLLLWNLSFEPRDLFTDACVPLDMATLAKQAWQLSLDSDYILQSKGTNYNFEFELQAVRDALARRPDAVDKLRVDKLEHWSINSSFFTNDSRSKWQEKTSDNSRVLSGLFRVMVVAMENFHKHTRKLRASACELSVELIENSDGQHLLTFSNECEQNTDEAANHSAFRGIELIDYLCRAFIKAGAPFATSPGDSPYKLTVPIGKPVWLAKTNS